jgi:E3 ubiquitin-protein ligase BRE1
MREYKREKATLEAQLNEVEKRSRFHDEELRTIDTWFDQVSTIDTCSRAQC